METAFKTWQEKKTPEALSALLNKAEPTIGSALTSYAGGDKAMRGKARALAIEAFQTYNPKKGTKIQTHLMNQLKPLYRHYQQYRNIAYIPERIEMDLNHLNRAAADLQDKIGHEPSDVELSDATGFPLKRIRRIKNFSLPSITESAFSGEDENDANDTMPGVYRPDKQKIWMDYVYHDLNPIDRKILEWKTGNYGHPVLSTNEIAKRLNITAGAVSQRGSRIAEKLAEGQSFED